ncbi:capsid protein [Grosmannia clavigera partitivirus 1]|nr:capsid protein [Grosmannia clavigera partitivirus 1]
MSNPDPNVAHFDQVAGRPATDPVVPPAAPQDPERPMPANPVANDTPLPRVNAVPAAPPENAGDFLSIVHDLALPRRIKFEKNYYVPNFSAMFLTLHHMDKLVIRKFKARRAAQLLCPPMHSVYFTLLIYIQIARCMTFVASNLAPHDRQFVETLLNQYPVESFAIPGPLLPFYKALTTFVSQNERTRRVSPRFPTGLMSVTRNHDPVASMATGSIFPYFPIVANLARRFQETFNAGAVPTVATFTKPWPFTYAQGSTTTYAQALNIGGHSFSADPSKWTTSEANNLACPASRYSLCVNTDIINMMSGGTVEDYVLPVFAENIVAAQLKNILAPRNDFGWIESFLAPMAEYANLWTGSGSLADCSPDGPAAGLYITKYTTVREIPRPVCPYDHDSQFSLNCQLRTTQGAPEPLNERLAALTQVHARLPDNHSQNGDLTAAIYRDGNVWDLRPIYGPSNEVTVHGTLSVSVARWIKTPFTA